MKYLPPVKAIKKFCYECSGDSSKERKSCIMKNCHLFPYRLGKNPNMSRKRRIDGHKKGQKYTIVSKKQ